LFRVLIILPLMFQISVRLTLIMLMTMPFVTLTVKYFGHQIHVRFERIQAFFSDITARAQENLTGVRVVRAFAQEQSEREEFARLNQQYVDRNLNLVRLSAVFRPLMQFFIGLGFAAIILIGGYETAQGHMTVGEFTAFNLYLELLIWPLIAMGYVTNLVQRGAAIGRWLTTSWDPQRSLARYAEQFIEELVAHTRRDYPGRGLIRRAPPPSRPNEPAG